MVKVLNISFIFDKNSKHNDKAQNILNRVMYIIKSAKEHGITPSALEVGQLAVDISKLETKAFRYILEVLKTSAERDEENEYFYSTIRDFIGSNHLLFFICKESSNDDDKCLHEDESTEEIKQDTKEFIQSLKHLRDLLKKMQNDHE